MPVRKDGYFLCNKILKETPDWQTVKKRLRRGRDDNNPV